MYNPVPFYNVAVEFSFNVDSADWTFFMLMKPLVDAQLMELMETDQTSHFFPFFVIRETYCATLRLIHIRSRLLTGLSIA